MLLRSYQQAAVDAVYRFLREHDGNPCVVCPTGSGKSVLLAQIASDAVTLWSGRVLIVTHVRELVEQNADKLQRLSPRLDIGLYSAGLKRRDTKQPVLLASIQSIYQRACDFEPFDLILIDECHLLPASGEGMYRTFLADARKINPHVRLVGFTATPFRLDCGSICGPDNLLHAVAFEIGVRELIRDGYLCPLVSKAGKARVDTSSLHVRGGEFVADEVEKLMDEDALVEAACAEIVELTQDRSACLIFASGIKHGRHIVQVLQKSHYVECGFVCGDTPTTERDELIARFRGNLGNGLFKNKPLKYLCNVGVLGTGFDAPRTDCIALLRPTMSAGLYAQQVGRGFRLHPDKANCLVLDFGGNILRHGPVDRVATPNGKKGDGTGEAPAKECSECQSVIAAGYARCPDCGYEFPPPERSNHDATASNAGILSGQVTKTTYAVQDEWYSVHQKRGAPEDAPKTMRVDYLIGLGTTQSEWVCFEHEGYARKKAEAWWHARTDEPVPETAEEAVRLANEGLLRQTRSITVRSVAGDKFDTIVDRELEPERAPIATVAEDDLPF